MDNDTLVQVKNLSRRYGDAWAVRDLSFTLRKGEVLGFLGPNGAGKTTAMQMLTGNLAPDNGCILINGVDLSKEPRRAKAAIGYLPEHPPVYRELTVDEYLRYCARLRRMSRSTLGRTVETAKKNCGLAEVGERLIGNLSKGYQQRVGIAQAIVHSPDLIVLDEPTVGLDPIEIREIRNLIQGLGRKHGVIVSTHILPEVQAVCSHVQIMRRGQLVYAGSLADLDRRQHSASLILGLDAPPAPAALAELPEITAVEALGVGRFRLFHMAEKSPAAAIAARVCAEGWGLRELTPERRGLEQIFIELTLGDAATEAAG